MVLLRLIPLLESALNSSSADRTEALKNLESQVSAVGTDADPQIVQSLTAEFPQANDTTRGQIKATIEATATLVKSTLLKDIQTLQTEEAQSLNAELYRIWLTKTRERYEKWLSRL